VTWRDYLPLAQSFSAFGCVFIIWSELKDRRKAAALKEEAELLLKNAEAFRVEAKQAKPKPLAVIRFDGGVTVKESNGNRWLECEGNFTQDVPIQGLSLDAEYRVEIHVLPKEGA